MSEKDSHRTTIRSIRFRPSEWQRIQERARMCGLPAATWMRSTLLGAVPPARKHPGDRVAVLCLSKVGLEVRRLQEHLRERQRPPVAQPCPQADRAKEHDAPPDALSPDDVEPLLELIETSIRRLSR